jgi:hypothetical protein
MTGIQTDSGNGLWKAIEHQKPSAGQTGKQRGGAGNDDREKKMLNVLGLARSEQAF